MGMRKWRQQIDADAVKALFTHDAGRLFWKRTGKEAGCLCRRSGYWVVGLGRRLYKRSRLVWALHHGEVPDILDHINRVRHDDRLENLRTANQMQNVGNASKSSRGTEFKGVWKHRKVYRAHIGISGKAVVIGSWPTPEEAAAAYNCVAREWFGEYANLNIISANTITPERV